MTLTVLNVAYPLARVAPETAGGAEQVVAALDAALTRGGHRSIVVASRGSRVSGMLVPTELPDGVLDARVKAEAARRHREAVRAAVERHDPDVIHLHGVDYVEYLPPPGPPVLVTLHLPPSWYPREALFPRRPGTYLQCVSAAQSRACPEGAPLLPEIPNGVDLALHRPARIAGSYAMLLGRICPEKGTHLAIDAAKAAGVPLAIAGSVYPYPEHAAYFAREVLPRLDRRRRFLGALGPERRVRLLSRARCLLVPSLCDETSSLAAMESLACGTPVVAFRRGALPEIVEEGVTGFLVEDAARMAEAVRRVATLDRAACRRAAEERFDLRWFLEATLARYAALASQKRAA